MGRGLTTCGCARHPAVVAARPVIEALGASLVHPSECSNNCPGVSSPHFGLAIMHVSTTALHATRMQGGVPLHVPIRVGPVVSRQVTRQELIARKAVSGWYSTTARIVVVLPFLVAVDVKSHLPLAGLVSTRMLRALTEADAWTST